MKRIKTILSSMLILVFLTAALAGASVYAANPQITGDLNLDGEVDMNDAILLLQYSMFPNLYELDYVGSVDFTNDGEVDMNDAILLLQHSMFPDLYPIEKEVFCTVTFYDLGMSSEPVTEPITVRAGSSAVYPDADEYELWYELGYEKSVDTKFFDEYVEESIHGYDYAHRLDYEWYCIDENGEFVRYDDSFIIEKDTDVYAKVRKIDIEIEMPKDIADVDEVLIFNVPYEENTRYLDFSRDALFFNADQIITKLEETGIEEKINSEYRETAGAYFEGDGVINGENEINKTDVYFYLYEMTGGKEEYELLLWDAAEKAVIEVLGENTEWGRSYASLSSDGASKQTLYKFFEDKPFGTPPETAEKIYLACKTFIETSLENNSVTVTKDNVFLMNLLVQQVSSEDAFERFAEKYIGKDCPEELFGRLPIHILEEIYGKRCEAYLDEMQNAIEEAKNGNGKVTVGCGIHFDINLVTEFLMPLLEHVEKVYTDAVERACKSDSKSAELVKLYHGENPYATSYADGYMLSELFVEDIDGDGLYSSKSLGDRYTNVMMPLEVEKADALLWLTTKTDFNAVEEIITDSKNKLLGLSLVNRINSLKGEYSENGLPESIADYYNDLLSDEVTEQAVAMLDNGEDFDMMFFVETKINYQLAEMFYLKMLNNLGIPDDKLISGQLAVEYTSEDYDNYVERLSEIWTDSYTVDEYLDEMFIKAGCEGENGMEIEMSGIKATLKRSVADTMFE